MSNNENFHAFRNALGSFATGVCVVTANRDGQAPFGMTVNSFASVSLDPMLVLWSVQNDSECFKVFDSTQAYCVNVLAENQLDISNQCASRDTHELKPEQYTLGEGGQAVLKGSIASFECEVWQRYDGGDHTILVGKVNHFEHRPNTKPLLFHAGKYAELA